MERAKQMLRDLFSNTFNPKGEFEEKEWKQLEFIRSTARHYGVEDTLWSQAYRKKNIHFRRYVTPLSIDRSMAFAVLNRVNYFENIVKTTFPNTAPNASTDYIVPAPPLLDWVQGQAHADEEINVDIATEKYTMRMEKRLEYLSTLLDVARKLTVITQGWIKAHKAVYREGEVIIVVGDNRMYERLFLAMAFVVYRAWHLTQSEIGPLICDGYHWCKQRPMRSIDREECEYRWKNYLQNSMYHVYATQMEMKKLNPVVVVNKARFLVLWRGRKPHSKSNNLIQNIPLELFRRILFMAFQLPKPREVGSASLRLAAESPMGDLDVALHTLCADMYVTSSCM